jgi:hypothetical protein
MTLDSKVLDLSGGPRIDNAESGNGETDRAAAPAFSG